MNHKIPLDVNIDFDESSKALRNNKKIFTRSF